MGMPRGGGGFNPNQMLKQLQKMQREMEDTQAQLAEEVVEGTAGGGVVTARVKGDQTVESVSIDPDALDPDDVEMLGDLVTAAVNEGLRKAKDLGVLHLPLHLLQLLEHLIGVEPAASWHAHAIALSSRPGLRPWRPSRSDAPR